MNLFLAQDNKSIVLTKWLHLQLRKSVPAISQTFQEEYPRNWDMNICFCPAVKSHILQGNF